jgi:hypothetical protein
MWHCSTSLTPGHALYVRTRSASENFMVAMTV